MLQRFRCRLPPYTQSSIKVMKFTNTFAPAVSSNLSSREIVLIFGLFLWPVDSNSESGDVVAGAKTLRESNRSESPGSELSRRLTKTWPSGPAVERGGSELETEILERMFSFIEAFQKSCTSGHSLLFLKRLSKKRNRPKDGRQQEGPCPRKRKNPFSEADLPSTRLRVTFRERIPRCQRSRSNRGVTGALNSRV